VVKGQNSYTVIDIIKYNCLEGHSLYKGPYIEKGRK